MPLTISDGGSLTFTAHSFTVNPRGVLTVTGAKSSLQSNGVFLEGTGQQLVIQNGGSADIGSLNGGGLLVDGAGSSLEISTLLLINITTTVTVDAGANPTSLTTLTMTGGATLNVGDLNSTHATVDAPSAIKSSGTLSGNYAISAAQR